MIIGIAMNSKSAIKITERIKNTTCNLYFSQLKLFTFKENNGISAFNKYELKTVIPTKTYGLLKKSTNPFKFRIENVSLEYS